MDHRTAVLWMKDVLDHLVIAYEQWQEADDTAAWHLADSMERDVDELRRRFACMHSLKTGFGPPAAVA